MNRSLRAFAYLCSALVAGTFAFGLLLAGWIANAVLLITPLVVPTLVGLRAAVGLFSRGEGELARSLLGADVGRSPLSSGGAGYWGRGKAVVSDASFWREQLFLVLRVVVGWPLAVAVLAFTGASLWVLGLPYSYRIVNENLGFWHIDTLQKAVLVMPLGLVGLAIVYFGVRPLAEAWRLAAGALLRPAGAASYREVGRTLQAHALATALVDAIVVVVWWSVGRGTFWPGWVIVGTGLPLALHAVAVWRRGSTLALHARISATLAVFFVLVWGLAGFGSFWPIWPALAFALLLGVHALVQYQRGGLEERIETLETSRAGAVDVQESELRRIERDLHDGAQARLVALGMNLGMAEQKLAADPEAARGLVAEARVGVEEALRELRDLARGIHPPVLADRGLEAAIVALAHRSAVPVFVDADVSERPPAAVETAAYFVAAEALTNAAKHAGATRIEVRIVREPGSLRVQVTDDGRGGADLAGSGLTGLRHRVEALDGRLTVLSPSGGGTTLLAELPCVS